MKKYTFHFHMMSTIVLGALCGVAFVTSPIAEAQTTGTIEDLGNFGGSGALARVNELNNDFEIVGTRTDAQNGAAADFLWKSGQVTSFGAITATDVTNGADGFPHQIVGGAHDINGTPIFARWFLGGSIEPLTLPSDAPWDPNIALFYRPDDAGSPLRVNSGSPVETILGKTSYNTAPQCAATPFDPSCASTLQDALFFVRRSPNPAEPTPPLAFVLRLDGDPQLGRFVTQYHLNNNADLLFDVSGSVYFFDGTTLALAKIGSGLVPVGINNARQAVLVGPAGSVLWTPTATTPIASARGGVAVGTDISENGVVAGRLVLGADSRAFVYSTERGLRDLNDYLPANSGWTLVEADQVNESGGVVGLGIFNGAVHHFLLRLPSPDPDPIVTVSSAASASLRFEDLQCLRGKKRCVLIVSVLNTLSQPVIGQGIAIQTPKKVRKGRKRVTIDQVIAAGATDATGEARFTLKLKSKPTLRAIVTDSVGGISATAIHSDYTVFRAPKKPRRR